MSPQNNPRITRDDIESRFREIQGDVIAAEDEARTSLASVVVVAGVVIVVIAFALGSRRGRKRRTVVEVRRF
ncbi:MAG: hypothetical protein F2520_05305 [Actinobacteria bacterium]|uniref:Unannotated protein n=1 Tax=freshwater metagenome TaxID=449393 RepID=A0A6J7IRA7_9ZZZZ|nr:hypothetical protein [Actinomycetota bacterium]MTA77658.1 hypothetical protein [Actinomycetota bacterium]